MLCIDADAESRLILMTALARPGFAVECVCDGQQALDRYTRDAGGFDVLVTDHQMPRGHGLALVRRLRESGFCGGIIVAADALTHLDRVAYRALAVSALLRDRSSRKRCASRPTPPRRRPPRDDRRLPRFPSSFLQQPPS